MKKPLAIILLMMTLLFNSTVCYSEQERAAMKNKHFKGFLLDDSKALESFLTNEYHISNLISFFGLGKYRQSIGFTGESERLGLTRVNSKYPLEIIRNNGAYSVYKVIEGGYFYVFWATPVDENVEPFVLFTSYLAGNRTSSLFDGLLVGIHTFQDAQAIDPSLELQLFLSNGVYSYSYLDRDRIIKIKYARNPEDFDLNRLMIAEISVIERSLAPSVYSMILLDDLPN